MGVSSAAPLRRFRLRSACGPRGRSVSQRVSAWARSRPSGLPLLGFSKVLNRAPRFCLSAARTVAGPSRGSRVASLVVPLSGLLAPVSGSHSPHSGHRTLGSPLHRHQRRVAAFPESRWPPLLPSSHSSAAPPKGYAQPSRPGATDATLLAPASRPRRLSRPRRCHHTWSPFFRHVLARPGRRVSASSLSLDSARVPRLSPVPAGVSSRPRLAPLLSSDPEVIGLCEAADHGVHQVSGGLQPRAAPLGAASLLGLSFPSMHSCPSEPSLPAVAAAHPRVLPSRCVSPGLPVAPSSVCLSLGSRARTPLSSFTRRHGLLLPRTPLRVCVAGASRPPMTASGRHSVCTLCRLEPVGCTSPRRCRFVSTSGYFRR